MDKVFVQDVPSALESITQAIRTGLRQIRDDNVALVQVPDKIDFDFTVIIRKDDLVRLETRTRPSVVTVIDTQPVADTETRVTSVGRTTDETETMTWVRTGGEVGGETGGETGGSSGGQFVTHSDTGGEVESYSYFNV